MIEALRHKEVDEVGRLVRLHNDAALRALRTFMASPAATERKP
jgi:hypothetical protein